ncbi:hypothetical protein ACH5RR_012673 [Cinchona calisaya]|uniref:Secreted protein n=1 Tax=Cinchona calisaya TaxID=153742 RepID=A0ABD3AC05_9GENT
MLPSFLLVFFSFFISFFSIISTFTYPQLALLSRVHLRICGSIFLFISLSLLDQCSSPMFQGLLDFLETSENGCSILTIESIDFSSKLSLFVPSSPFDAGDNST